jgi:branched-chain amino acid aminotransferase
LYGPDHTITEVGAMNIFILLDKGKGAKELVTPPLEGGIILPGITRFKIASFLFSLIEFIGVHTFGESLSR